MAAHSHFFKRGMNQAGTREKKGVEIQEVIIKVNVCNTTASHWMLAPVVSKLLQSKYLVLDMCQPLYLKAHPS